MQEKLSIFNCPHCGKPIGVCITSYITKVGTSTATKQVPLVDQVKKATSKWTKDLNIVQKNGTVIVTPKSYLGRDIWQQINDCLNPFKPEWVSAGKESRWIIKSDGEQ